MSEQAQLLEQMLAEARVCVNHVGEKADIWR